LSEPDTPEEPEAAPEAAPEPEPRPASGSREQPAAPADEPFSVEGMMEALRQAKVSELVLSTVSTLASVAYGKLELPDLPEAKEAIDAIGALMPLLAGKLDAGILRDFEQALANLRLAYADAVSKAQ